MATSENSDPKLEVEESLLYSARHGELKVVKALLEANHEGKLTLDINCKGQTKSNLGWTPLILATYFGHVEVVEALLCAGADVDDVNEAGDTALHKASFIGNEELVILLLKYKADVNVMNGEGRTAGDVCKTRDVQRLLEAAQRSERHERERKLLTLAKAGQVQEIQELLSSPNPPNINCVDAQGNTCLHCAAYRGHARLAVLLLQNGVDTTLKNNSGQLAIDMAKDQEMRDVLSVRPVQRLQRTAARFEGPLLKRSRFLGWRPVWAVLQRGVLLYYGSRADAAREGGRWRARKYLDGAALTAPDSEPALLVVAFSDGDQHRLCLPRQPERPAAGARQSWITALNEHIAYSGHYLWAGAPDAAREATEDLEDECKPLGSMQDALTAATNSLALLDTQLRECSAIVAALDKSVNVGNSLHHSAYMRFQHACGTGAEALGSLRHCAALVAQARDADRAKLNREIERNRVLEEALAALARTHHALEMSVAEELTKSKRKKKSSQNDSKENFFDVFDDTDDDDDTLVTAGLSSPLGALSPWGSSPDLLRRTPVGSLDGEPPTPHTPRHDTPRHDDTLVTAGLSSPLGALSPWGSSPDLLRRTPVGSLDGEPPTPHTPRHDTPRHDDTLVTAGLSSPLGALSPWGSSPDLLRRTPVGSLDGEPPTPHTPRHDTPRHDDTLVTAGLSSPLGALSPWGSSPDLLRRTPVGSLDGEPPTPHTPRHDTPRHDDTLVTAGLSSPLGALSPWGSSPDLLRRTPVGSLDGEPPTPHTPRHDTPRHDDTLVTAGLSSPLGALSPWGSSPDLLRRTPVGSLDGEPPTPHTPRHDTPRHDDTLVTAGLSSPLGALSPWGSSPDLLRRTPVGSLDGEPPTPHTPRHDTPRHDDTLVTAGLSSPLGALSPWGSSPDLLRRTPVGSLDGEPPTPHTPRHDTPRHDDTLVTAGLSSPLGALSPWGSSPDLLRRTPVGSLDGEPPTPHTPRHDTPRHDDTLVTAGLSSPLGALSPWGSSPDLLRRTPVGSLDGEPPTPHTPRHDTPRHDDTLVTAGLSSPLGALSPWGSSPDLLRRTPVGSLDGEPPTPHTPRHDTPRHDDTLVTAGLSSPLGALSPWGSSPDLLRRTPVGSLDGDATPTNERNGGSPQSGSPTSLHTALSPASSRGTLVSHGGHVYRNARPHRRHNNPSSQWSL